MFCMISQVYTDMGNQDVPNLSHYFHIAKDMRSSELEQIRERRRERSGYIRKGFVRV